MTRRRSLVRLVLAALLAATAAVSNRATAAAGDTDLEVTVVGVAGTTGVGGTTPIIDWTVTLVNNANAGAVTTTATNVVVRDVLTATPTPATTRLTPTVTAGTYNGAGQWTVASLAAGSTAILRFQTRFQILALNANGILSAEVIAQGQPDLDSAPIEDADVGNQDDEAVYRIGAGTNRTVGDLAWNDLDGDGRSVSNEPGVAGVQVLVTQGATRLFAGRTNATGIWSYAGVPNGASVVVRYLAPAGAVFTGQDIGSETQDSDVDSTGTAAARTISANDPNIDAGLRIYADLSLTKSATPSSGSIPLTVTYVVRVTNAGSGPAAGVVATDVFPGGAVLVGTPTASVGSASATSAGATWTIGAIASGTAPTLTYQLRYDSAGTYTNRAQITAATTLDPDSTPATSGNPTCASQSTQDDCAEATVTASAAPTTGTVSGVVWRDANGDGQRGGGESLQQGATVRLRSTGDTVLATTTTAANGSYSFTSAPTGSVIVEVVAPNGTRFTVRDTGADATDSDVDATTGRVTVTVPGGGTVTADAGLVRSDAPTADTAIVPQGVSVTFNVLDNDGIPGRTTGGSLPSGWTWTRSTGPSWGSVTCTSAGSCTYRSVDTMAGTDTFDYVLTNPSLGASTITVTLTVLYVDDAPVARADRAVTSPGTAVAVAVLANDEDPNTPAVSGDPNAPGDTLTVTTNGVVTPSGAGTAACGSGSCTFTPASGFTGSARFSYTVTDSGISDDRVDDAGVPGGLAAVAPRSASATVDVWVDPAAVSTTGFHGGENTTSTSGTGSWSATTVATATPACVSGRPQITISWTGVSRATGYRIERLAANPPTGTNRWVVLTTTAAGTTAFVDALIGEGTSTRYRVTPLRHRWPGTASAIVTALASSATSPSGC